MSGGGVLAMFEFVNEGVNSIEAIAFCELGTEFADVWFSYFVVYE